MLPPLHELPVEELWALLRRDLDLLLQAVLRLDVAPFLELQRLARAEGAIPARTWEAVPGDPSRRQLRIGETLATVGHAPDGEPVLFWLPHNGRETVPRPPRGPAGMRPKLTDAVLRRHVQAHPDLTHAQRARMLTHELGLTGAPLHRQTIARRVRALKKV